MAEVIPFKGVLYNVPKVSGLSGDDLLAPPYDIITPEYREELYSKSPYNIVRIDFGKSVNGDDEHENKYLRARAYLGKWLKEGILIRSREPFFYSYEISYKMDNSERTLRGFLGLVRIEELGKGSIHPHECTHSKPKKDRLELMRVCGANISPIFSLYSSGEKRASAVLSRTGALPPFIEARDTDGSIHRLRQITDAESVDAIREELRNKPVFIADGHHRYETALEYRNEMRAKEEAPAGPRPYDYVLMFLANMADEGLTILPTHRLIKQIPEDMMERLSAHFLIEKVDAGEITRRIAGRRHVIGFYRGAGEEGYILDYKGGDLSEIPPALADLDVSILHELVLGRLLHESDIAYEMDVRKCLQLVREGGYAAAFFLNPTRVEDVEKVALSSLRMPPKSTYFYPKLLTGLVLNIFNNTF
jgi:uncharacterized protein (DUF1015 family)